MRSRARLRTMRGDRRGGTFRREGRSQCARCAASMPEHGSLRSPRCDQDSGRGSREQSRPETRSPHARHLGITVANDSAQTFDRFAQLMKFSNDGSLRSHVSEKLLTAFSDPRFDVLHRLADVIDIGGRITTQSGTASDRTCEPMRGRRAHTSTTSTSRPRRSLRSATRPPGNHGVTSEPASIRKSTSLSGPASPRATEPNTQMLVTPCFAAMRRICSRFSPRISSIPMRAFYAVPARARLPAYPARTLMTCRSPSARAPSRSPAHRAHH